MLFMCRLRLQSRSLRFLCMSQVRLRTHWLRPVQHILQGPQPIARNTILEVFVSLSITLANSTYRATDMTESCQLLTSQPSIFVKGRYIGHGNWTDLICGRIFIHLSEWEAFLQQLPKMWPSCIPESSLLRILAHTQNIKCCADILQSITCDNPDCKISIIFRLLTREESSVQNKLTQPCWPPDEALGTSLTAICFLSPSACMPGMFWLAYCAEHCGHCDDPEASVFLRAPAELPTSVPPDLGQACWAFWATVSPRSLNLLHWPLRAFI